MSSPNEDSKNENENENESDTLPPPPLPPQDNPGGLTYLSHALLFRKARLLQITESNIRHETFSSCLCQQHVKFGLVTAWRSM